MSISEQFILLLIVAAPVTVGVIVAMFRGYNFHFTKHRITEHEKQEDEPE